jgi:arabinogalactan endo-1,4-beta-galactosidase
MNAARLRVWHTPAGPYSGLEDALALARRARAAGLSLVLDLHYSDHWADPGKQTKPAAWRDLHGEALEDAVREYTREVVAALAAQGTLPEVVQLGNEIIGGMLWDDGRVGGAFEGQWPALAGLLAAAAEGVRAGAAPEAAPKLMIHIDRGGDPGAAQWFYGNLAAQGVEYDLIGLSFYPWWHGTQVDLHRTLDAVARFQRPVVLVEVAHPFTLADHDAEPNFVATAEGLQSGEDATPDGQRAYLDALLTLAAARGVAGVFWWAPEYLGVPGLPSPWDNMTLFDDTGRALPAFEALCRAQ